MRKWDSWPLEYSLLQLNTCQTLNFPVISLLTVPSFDIGNLIFSEWDAFHDLIVVDELARCGYLGVNWGLSCGNAIGCPPIINHGSPAQKRKFLPPILRGEKRMCLAVTEPSGSHPHIPS
jgi:alkylation response protein AidB-like acyl-CoA dehydrogenase